MKAGHGYELVEMNDAGEVIRVLTYGLTYEEAIELARELGPTVGVRKGKYILTISQKGGGKHDDRR